MRQPLFLYAFLHKVTDRETFIAWLRFRRGRPVKASRYALRVSRSVVITLSLLRRNAKSESKAACGRHVKQLQAASLYHDVTTWVPCEICSIISQKP